MKFIARFTFILHILLVSFVVNGQASRVTWSADVVGDGEVLTIEIKGKTNPGWHIYTTSPPDILEGPLPTVIEFEKPENYELVGGISEERVEVHTNSQGEKEGVFVSNPGIFRQKIKRKNTSAFKIPIFIEFQTCDDKTCEQHQANVVAQVSASGTVGTDVEVDPPKDPGVDTTASAVLDDSTDHGGGHAFFWKVQAYLLWDSTYKLNFTPMDTNRFRVNYSSIQDMKLNGLGPGYKLKDTITAFTTQFEGRTILEPSKPFSFFLEREKEADSLINVSVGYTAQLGTESFDGFGDLVQLNLNQVSVEGGTDDKEQSYWAIFIIAFLSGFAALLTPCVFPMIPMTVSYFTKTSKTKAMGVKNALIYGVSIIIIYVALGLIVTGIFGADALNALSTNVWFNIAFFLLLVIFGISFLGAFEITLPAKWVNKVDRQADRGGLIGIFFMAFALALVSFSCTGPIIGTLLVKAAEQGGLSPFFGMLGFSLALALPFGLFAAFPGWLNSLPKSGGWLNSVKVVLGLLEIALALKFLSKADLVTQAHLLERELFIAIWIVIFGLIGLYLIGKIKFPHDSPLSHISIPRFGFAVVAFTFMVYLIPGLWGAPLNIIAGFPPPMDYSESPYGIGGTAPDHGDLPEGAHMDAHGILLFNDLDDAKAHSQDVEKPIMIDFTGYGCENCRKMEQTVWYNAEILPYLKDSVVVASLHCDDKTMLPASEQYVTDDGYRIRSVGNKWSELERRLYKKQAQPLYVIWDKSDMACGIFATYESHGEVPLFKKWLEDNLNEYRARKNALVYKDDGRLDE